ncbi:hypothetical protein PA07B_07522 [Cutibacterium acnes P07B]|nr:hypothetical protein [Cutibacterium acnes P07B]
MVRADSVARYVDGAVRHGMKVPDILSSMSLYGAALMRSQEPGVNPGLLRSGDGDDVGETTGSDPGKGRPRVIRSPKTPMHGAVSFGSRIKVLAPRRNCHALIEAIG